MQILLTNDDGIHAPGIKALAQTLQSLGNVTVVAPLTEQSGISHALTFRTPLVVRQMTWDNGMKVWAVEGTPTDCTRIGVLNLCEQRPDLVISGMNQGLNIGSNVIYSGTVAGAEEGATLGIDSFAVSLEYDEMPPWEKATELAIQVIRRILEARITSYRANLININVPISACYSTQQPEVRIVPVDQTPLSEAYTSRQGPHGVPYFWLTGRVQPSDPNLSTDRTMWKKGFVTVTPLEYNRTNRAAIEKLELAFDTRLDVPPEELSEIEANRLSEIIVRGQATKHPDSNEVRNDLYQPGINQDHPSKTNRGNKANYNNLGTSIPPRSNPQGSNDAPPSYSEGT